MTPRWIERIPVPRATRGRFGTDGPAAVRTAAPGSASPVDHNFYDDQMYSFTTINLDVWRTVSQVTTPGYGSTTVIVNDTDGHTRSY